MADLPSGARPIPGRAGYLVTPEGAVWSTRGRQPRELRPAMDTHGYRQVVLTRRGNHRVHVLVALTFIGPRPPGFTINHKDGVKAHNGVANLEYVTQLDNHRHAAATGLKARGERNAFAKMTDERVRAAREMYRTTGMSMREVGRHFGLGRSSIARLLKGTTWRHVTDGGNDGR